MTTLAINRRQYMELEKIALGAYAPLTGFMTEEEFARVVAEMRLPGGQVFPLPVVLDVSKETADSVRGATALELVFDGQAVGALIPESCYTSDKPAVARQVYGTDDPKHPGVAHFFSMGMWFVGGRVQLTNRVRFEFSAYEFTPAETRAHFAKQGWETIAGFQTRNAPHRAHEYLQRLALEQVDGLFIQPLVGRKKRGDYDPMAILAAYRVLIDRFLPRERVLLGVFSAPMRYAGPREALFHAIVRRNYGCTHFIIGRDHAGVGSYYGKYEAHELVRRFEAELGIKILYCCGPFYCARCDGIVTERTCPHETLDPAAVHYIAGTDIRSALSNGGLTRDRLVRPEVLDAVRGQPLFIEDDAE